MGDHSRRARGRSRRGGRRFRADRATDRGSKANETTSSGEGEAAQRRVATQAEKVSAQLLAWFESQRDRVNHPGDVALLERLETAVARRELDLPHFPETPLALDAVLEDPEPSLGSILAVVSRDPALVQRLLNAASGTGYRGAPRTLDEAITRVGLDEVWRLGVQCAVHSVFLVPGYQDEVVRIRDRGLLAGEVAAWLVGRTRGPVYLAGVFSGVGDLLVVREAARSPRDKRPRRAFVSAVRGALAVHMSLLAAHEWRLWEGCAVALGHRLDPLRAPARHRPAALAVACAAACVARSEDESAPRPPIDAWLEALLGEEGLAQAAVLEQVRVARVRLGLSIRDYQAGRFGR